MDTVTVEIDTAVALALLNMAEASAPELEDMGGTEEQVEAFLENLRKALGMG